MQRLLGLILDPPRGLRNNLNPLAVDLDFPVPTVAVVLVVWPTPERISAPIHFVIHLVLIGIGGAPCFL